MPLIICILQQRSDGTLHNLGMPSIQASMGQLDVDVLTRYVPGTASSRPWARTSAGATYCSSSTCATERHDRGRLRNGRFSFSTDQSIEV